MNTQNLTRKNKRALASKAARLYGLKGEAALAIHQAYLAAHGGDMPGALRLAHPVTQSHPGNPHAWILLGSAALAQREGANAKAFFSQAVGCAPRNNEALAGLGKAHVLCAEVEPGISAMERAIAAGSRDVPMLLLYISLMARKNARLRAADRVEPLLSKIKSADLALKLGEALLEHDELARAAGCFERAHACAPGSSETRNALAEARLYRLRLPEAEALARELVAEGGQDQAALVLISALRLQGRGDEALAFAEAHEFTKPEALAQARAMSANLYFDAGDVEAAEDAYQEAIHIAGEQPRILKGYGSFLYRAGRYAEGLPHYSKRILESQRRLLPESNASPENLQAQDRLFVIAEQGIGDQIALMAMLRHAPLRPEVTVTVVGDPRLGPLLQGNMLGLHSVPQGSLATVRPEITAGESLLLGDLTRYLPDRASGSAPSPYLRADPDKVAEIRARYAEIAGQRPLFGLAWASRSVIGMLRSIPLAEMVQALPKASVVVSLQYGDTDAEIAEAKAVRPDILFHTDRDIDQMADLAGLAAQITALDRIVTIDNTTAHFAGALGHEDTYLLLPSGSECMWYWGETGSEDPWYGCLRLRRQQKIGDWSGLLAELASAF